MPPKKKTTASASKKPQRKACKKSSKDPRQQIKVLELIEALERHVLGKQEMTATQVKAALALLKKTLPDIKERSKTPKDARITHEDALRELE